jgi:DDE superfamily endonuclease
MDMTIVNAILKQMPAVGRPQRQFLVLLFSTILALRGRVNFRHLSRYGDYSERTIARQFRRAFDWPDVHQRVITTALHPQAEVISAQDASCIPKSGQQTVGLGHFFNGCAGRAERGLEISTLAVVDVPHRCAFTLAVAQTPPTCATATKQEQETTLVDCYAQQLRAHHHRLPAWVAYHAVDGYCAKKQYLDAVVDLRRHPITKLRGDAACRFLFTGPHPKRRGAHRKYDGKVHWQDWSRFEALGTLAEAAHVHL